ncbi:MAG: YMGG-like glycine zipper-containing protein [Desulfobacteraceae bacterium]|nr:YMGG-like glycine zipper-containing protein [Desulfobacteraceae bacterium]
MKRIMYALVILAFATTFGCAGMSHTQQTTLSGGAIGAAGGAVLGAVIGGNPAVGAAVGGAAGAGVGYIVGEHDQGRW